MRNVVHCKRAPFDVYIGRPSKWGNPFSHKKGTAAKYTTKTRAEAIASYRTWLWAGIGNGTVLLDELSALDGKVLGCWCHPKACHGEVLTRVATWATEEILRQQ